MADTVSESGLEASPDWSTLERHALMAFMEIGTSDSPGMVGVLARAVRYAKIDTSADQIIIDRRAFIFGLVSSGQLDTPSESYGNTATWVAAFIAQRSSQVSSLLSSGLTGTDLLLDAARREFSVAASRSLIAIAGQASKLAMTTVKRSNADLRHFFVAFILDPSAPLKVFPELGWNLSIDDLALLKRELYRRLALHPEPEEDLKAWRSILGVGAAGDSERSEGHPTEPSTPPLPNGPTTIPPTEVSGFASDRPDALPAVRNPLDPYADPLKLIDDVTAFARLICLEEVEPPLSIGLFGGWGSGKSTFMHLLEAKIADITKKSRDKHALRQATAATTSSGPASAATPEPPFIRNAVQIRFNAWHFADANLWASLTAEFFDQFRAGGYAGSGKSIHSRLVERVNNLVHSLTTEAKAAREALANSEQKVREAQQQRDIAAVAATTPVGAALTQTLVDAAVAAYAKHRDDLDELGGKRTAKDIATFIALSKSVQTIGGQAGTLVRFVFGRGWRGWLAIVGFLLVGWASYAIVNTDLLSRFGLINVAGLIAGLGALGRSILPGIQLIAGLVKSTAKFASGLDGDLEARLKSVAEKEEELKKATAETEALRAAADRATRALARYVDPKNTANPPRLLRFMLEDNPDTQALEKEIGLISRVRRLFQAVNEIVDEEKKLPEDQRDPNVPDRIIIYIDDLDRCTPSQVYAVLQAIHLLLAFELFVVVVGVDMRWVEEALAHELRPSLRGLQLTAAEALVAEQEARKLAARYMEKIFQLPFWLRRLSPDGPDGGSYGNYVRSMLQRNLEAPGNLDLGNIRVTRDPAEALAKMSTTLSDVITGPLDAQPTDPTLALATDSSDDSGLDEALATVKLTQAEVDFLASEAIGRLAGREPRTVKRLVNIYRIIRARFGPADRIRFLGNATTSAAFPIVAMLIAVETGQPVEIAFSLHNLVAPNTSGPLVTVDLADDLKQAFAAVERLRDGASITREELAEWSAVASRYSFHRYD